MVTITFSGSTITRVQNGVTETFTYADFSYNYDATAEWFTIRNGDVVLYRGFADSLTLNGQTTAANINTALASVVATNAAPTTLVATADATAISTITYADISTLTVPVVAGTYEFMFMLPYTVPATTTGSSFSLNGPATSALQYNTDHLGTAATARTLRSSNAYDSGAATTASAATNGLAMIRGTATFTAAGNLVARGLTEVASSNLVVKAGAFVVYRRLL
jgi:hypothetical protein